MTRIAIKYENIVPHSRIFYVMDEFKRTGLDKLVDYYLGKRCANYGYQYSDILLALFCIYLCGGDHIEDITTHLKKHLIRAHGAKIPSSDDAILYKYMGRYCPKEGKNRRKVTFQFQTQSILIFHIAFSKYCCIFVQHTPHVLRSPAKYVLTLHYPTRNGADATTDNTPATAQMKNRQASRAHSAYA